MCCLLGHALTAWVHKAHTLSKAHTSTRLTASPTPSPPLAPVVVVHPHLPQVWDVRRLERDVSFASRLTYAGQSGRITGVCPVLDGASVASASSSGSLHVWRVEYISKAGGWAPDKYRGEG